METLLHIVIFCWASTIMVLLLIGDTPQTFNHHNHKNFIILTALAFPFLILLMVVDLIYQFIFWLISYFLNLGVSHEHRGDRDRKESDF
jgi:hypothetical protein